MAHRILARLLANRAREDPEDRAEALRLARRAVELAPDNPESASVLGVALYRTGAWQEAIQALEKSMRRGQGRDPVAGLVLAMAHHRLGQSADARKWYDGSVRVLERRSSVTDEQKRLRAEAEALLGIPSKGKDG